MKIEKIDGSYFVVLSDGAKFKLASNQDYEHHQLRKAGRDQNPRGNSAQAKKPGGSDARFR